MNFYDMSYRAPILVGAIILAYAFAIDFLPTTKMPRTHYQMYPLLIAFILLSINLLIVKQANNKRSVLLKIIGTVVILIVFLLNFKLVHGIKQSKNAFPDFLSKNPQVKNIYLLKEDPHTIYIEKWLNDDRVRFIEIKTLNKILESESKDKKMGILVVGPTGKGSGNSILRHSSLPDFDFDPPADIEAKILYFPYMAYYPTFIFEEEISQALYFEGKIPSYHEKDKKIKAFII